MSDLRSELRQVINAAADNIHDATQWDQRCEADDDGLTPMDRLVDRIERLYGINQDDDEPVTEEWLKSIGFTPRGDHHPDFGPILQCPSGFILMAANGRFVHLSHCYYADQRTFIGLENKETRGQVRQLCAALGYKPAGV